MPDKNSKSRKFRFGGLQGKIFKLSVMMVIMASIGFALVGIIQLRNFQHLANEAGKEQAETISEVSGTSVTIMTEDSMMEIANKTATATSWDFWVMQHDTLTLANQVYDVITHQEKYEEREVLAPSKDNKNRLALQLLQAEGADPTPEDMILIRKLASLEPMMREMIEDNEYFTNDLIIALSSGVSLNMDTLSHLKVDENGKPKPFDPTKRPWWDGAQVTKKAFLALPSYSEILGETEMEFGVPVYVEDELVAVVEGSITMSRIEDELAYGSYVDSSFFVMVNEDGVIIYSPRESGELAVDHTYKRSILESGNAKLIELFKEARYGNQGFDEIMVDGEQLYIAYGNMVTIDWQLFMFVSRDELTRPTQELVDIINYLNDQTVDEFAASYIRSLWIILAVTVIMVVIAAFEASWLSARLTRPINHMTENVESISGDSFSFEMDEIYHTGDEIETLAGTFAELSDRTQKYIEEITDITAEKERIAAELDVAAKIQSNMLPKRFPLFPDRNEFELYATMTPAKEVGGDFYDMYLLDDDHLCLVIADVSGKGVPAALFMVVSKTMIKNRAYIGGRPSEILRDVNNSLCENNDENMFVTVWVGILTISTGELIQASAGHEYPVIRKKDEDYKLIETDNGMVLGIMKDLEFEDLIFKLNVGDSLFTYTDGLPEATNAEDQRLELEGMMEALNRHKEDSPGQLLSDIQKEVDAFVKEAPQFDDLTMMILRYNGKTV